MDNEQAYDYTAAGFDRFFVRNPDAAFGFQGADAGTPPGTTAIPFDRGQQSGSLGNTLSLGNVKLNPTNITVSDGQFDRLLLGEDDGGF